MKTFTVHMPPPSGEPQKDALDALFIREGFAIWAFVFPLLWLIVKRMWLVLLGYLAVIGLLEGAALLVGMIAPGVFAILTGILFGLEANTLRRWTLDRNGYRFVGIAAGRTLEDAEQRFFDGWTGTPSAGPEPRSAPFRGVRPSGQRPVAGLFPLPGNTR